MALPINNAGYGLRGALEEASLEQAKGLFETNFFGAVRMVNAVLPTMRRQRRGTIINVSSIAGIAASPFLGFYSDSKYALEGYTEALRQEVKSFGVRVALIEPGFFQSKFAAMAEEPQQPIADYAELGQRATAFFDHAIETGIELQAISRRMLQIVQTAHPPLRSLVGADAKVFALSKGLEPALLAEIQTRLLFRLDNRPIPEALFTAFLRMLGVGRPRRTSARQPITKP